MHVLVVIAHPKDDSLTHALADAVTAGARRGGHEVTTLDLYELGFRAAMSNAERLAYHGDQPLLDPLAAEHAALVASVDTLVFVYPTWWSGLPAILKGWLERVMVPGVAFRFNSAGKVRPALGNVERIVGVSTYGSPWAVVKLLHDGGRRTLLRTLRANCGLRTATTWLALYSVDNSGDEECAAFLDRVEHTMAHLGGGHPQRAPS